MLKIYVAGKNLKRAKFVMNMLREEGFHITFDWLSDIENEVDPIKKAFDEREGVKRADVLVYLWEADQESARYEAGMAMGFHKPIIVSGTHKAWFFSLPEVVCVERDEDIIPKLSSL